MIYKNKKHPSHETRFSFDSFVWDEICIHCGYTDSLGSWVELAFPCPEKDKTKQKWK